jgi:hypothetical protein
MEVALTCTAQCAIIIGAGSADMMSITGFIKYRLERE